MSNVRIRATFGPRKPPPSLRTATGLDTLQGDVFAALIATLPPPVANENLKGERA